MTKSKNITEVHTYINYVYVLLNPQKRGVYCFGEYKFDYEPFYVGRGKYYRFKDHFSKSSLAKNSPKNRLIKKLLSKGIEPIIIIIKDKLPNLEAHRIENNIIKLIGRLDLNEGVLLNRIGGKTQNL